jgi:hydroxymethylglutaryl-CoA lyase
MAEVTIVDTGPRDGPVSFPKMRTQDKVLLANSLIASGVMKIDCVAFTHPRIRPEYADAEKVVEVLDKRPGLAVIGLAPNEVACRRALNTDVDEIGVLVSVSETFNQSVLGCGVRKTLYKTIPAIIQACKEKGKKTRAFLLSAFWCQFEGCVELSSIIELTSKLAYLGIDEISLVDTPGLANPRQVKKITKDLLGLGLEANLAVHFHNTRGLGLTNCLAAYEAGVRIFDTAIGGISGTPYGAPTMALGSWNVPTEDLIYLFEQIGINTGIDIDAIAESAQLAQDITGRELPGHLLRARKAFVPSNFSTKLAL